jgi:hypothetical protein
MPSYNKAIVLAFFAEQRLPDCVTEHEFARGIVEYQRKDGRMDTRRWAFDFAWLDQKVALEVEGLNGRHQRIAGFLMDMQKYNTATELGWLVLRTTVAKVATVETAEMIARVMFNNNRL